jgi:hypothetical protein
MLDIEIIPCTDIDRATAVFHRDGFAAVSGTLTPDQLAFAQAGARRVIAEQLEAIPLEKANRGYARYSFGSQIHHPEWTQLIDLPTVLPIVENIFGSRAFHCAGAGGDYSVPGAKIQHLHADMLDFFNDPLGRVTFRDVPTPFIVVNFMMVDFTEQNGAIRFVPGTHRSRHPVPTLEEEPDWMKRQTICAPAGTALFRDVRCWHGGTANRSNEIRPMTSVGYYAPWFRQTRADYVVSRSLYAALAPRAKELCRDLLEDHAP